MEVYNECVYDLLVPPSEGHDKLQIQKRGKDVVVPVSGLSSEYCLVDTEDFYMLPISDFWPVVLLLQESFVGENFRESWKKDFRREHFHKKCHTPKFHGENFHKWSQNLEIHESFLPRKFPAVWYHISDLWQPPLYYYCRTALFSEVVGHCMLPYIRDQILELVKETLLVVLS